MKIFFTIIISLFFCGNACYALRSASSEEGKSESDLTLEDKSQSDLTLFRLFRTLAGFRFEDSHILNYTRPWNTLQYTDYYKIPNKQGETIDFVIYWTKIKKTIWHAGIIDGSMFKDGRWNELSLKMEIEKIKPSPGEDNKISKEYQILVIPSKLQEKNQVDVAKDLKDKLNIVYYPEESVEVHQKGSEGIWEYEISGELPRHYDMLKIRFAGCIDRKNMPDLEVLEITLAEKSNHRIVTELGDYGRGVTFYLKSTEQ